MNSTDEHSEAGIVVLQLLHICSAFCVIIHLYKFFKNKSTQNSPSKNLAFYCIILLVLYSVCPVSIWFVPLLRAHIYVAATKVTFITIFLYFMILTTTWLKFIMALDVYLCFRKIALQLRPRKPKFVLNCILGIGLPLLFTVLVYLLFHFSEASQMGSIRKVFHWTIIIIRILRIVPIVGAFWYIIFSNVERTELRTKFSLHIRLLVMLGAFSAMLTVVQIILVHFVFDGNLDKMWKSHAFKSLADNVINGCADSFGLIMEGLMIGICFTFRKFTFDWELIGMKEKVAFFHFLGRYC